MGKCLSPHKNTCFVVLKMTRVVLQMRKCHALDEKMKEMDREITVNPQYVQKVG